MKSRKPVRRCQLVWSHRPQSSIVPTRLPQTLIVKIQWFHGDCDEPDGQAPVTEHADHEQDRPDAGGDQRDRQEQKACATKLIGLSELFAVEVDHAW